jgi:site-specific DNA recombinase
MENSSKQVAAYCRVSTLEQKKKGLGMDIQVRDVMAFAEARGLTIDRCFKDDAQCGAAESRKQLNKLVRSCEKGVVGTLIIPALDRLSRKVRIAENLFHQFNQLGVDVLIADMPTYDGRNRRDVMVRQIREVIAEDNREEIIERLWKGRQERVRKGKYPGGNTPYGYERIQKRLVIRPIEAQVIRAIFDLATVPLSSAEIAEQLTAGCHRQRNGSEWSARQVRSILSRSDLYRSGIVQYGGVKGIDTKLILIIEKGTIYDKEIEVGAAL